MPHFVTELKEHPRRQGRFLVAVDGERLGAVGLDTVADLQLKAGRELSEPEFARLQSALRATACYDKALDALARRARSRAELGRWLKQREFTAAEIEPALDKLEDLGLLNDREFARGFARSRLAPGRGLGPRRVMAELARRGVARALVDEVLSELTEEEGRDEGAAIREVASRKLRTMAGLAPEVRRRRLYGFLARRGFDGSLILAVLREID